MQPIDLKQHMPDDIDDAVGIMQLVTGEADGRAFWAYIVMRPSTYVEYVQKVEAREEINLLEYGEVLERGWGDTPPEEVQQRMVEEYGANPNFQEEIEQFLREELAAEQAAAIDSETKH